MRWMVLVLLMIEFAPLDMGLTGLVSAVDIDFSCPDDIVVDEEFECLLEVFDSDGVYDVKVDFDGERNSVLEIWNGDAWMSGYYYVKSFVDEDGEYDVKLRVSEADDWDCVVKLRKSDKVEFFDVEIEVGEEDIKKEVVPDKDLAVNSEEIESPIIKMENEVIMLGDVDRDVGETVVYASRNSVALDYSVYVFCGVLILIIGFLLWERF